MNIWNHQLAPQILSRRFQEGVDPCRDNCCQATCFSERVTHSAKFDIQGYHPYVALMDALRILFNILLFTASLFAAALVVEKI